METVTWGIGLNLARQSFLGDKSDEILHRTRVGIVGLGGGGSHIAQQLAHVGIGNILLLDEDRIEDTNLNRLVGGRASDVKRRLSKRTEHRELLSEAAQAPSRKQIGQRFLRTLNCEKLAGSVYTFAVFVFSRRVQMA